MPQSTQSARKRSHGKRKKRHSQASSMAPEMSRVERLSPPQPVRRRWPWLVLLSIAIVLIGVGIWRITSGTSSATSAAITSSKAQSMSTATATPPPAWHTLLTFSGNTTTKNTQKFKVPANWQLSWSCRGVNGVDGGLYIVIYNADGSLYNAGAQITCLASKQVIGNVVEPQSGYIYLNINGNDPWTVSVQTPSLG